MSSEFGWVEIERPTQDVAVVVLHGEHDLSTADNLTSELDRLSATGVCVVLDLSAAEFIDSSIIGAIHRFAAGQAQAGRGFALQVSTSSIVHRALDIAGMLSVPASAQSRAAAIDLARAAEPESDR